VSAIKVFLEEVRPPAENLVGDVYRGWNVATTTLDLERSSIVAMGNGRPLVDDPLTYARSTVHGGRPVAVDARVRRLLTKMHFDVELSRMLSYCVAWLRSRGRVPNTEAS
jgi:alkylation response protein AidB-like acyl-CoA dehydrogenase